MSRMPLRTKQAVAAHVLSLNSAFMGQSSAYHTVIEWVAYALRAGVQQSAFAALELHASVAVSSCNKFCDGHSMTSSARASSVGGTVRLSAFAVFRFMMSSNSVGA